MDRIKAVARGQVVTFIIGLAINVFFAFIIAGWVAKTPAIAAWPLSAEWLVIGALCGFQTIVVILSASHKAVGELDNQVKAALGGLDQKVRDIVTAAIAPIKPDLQRQFDKEVLDAKHTATTVATDRANTEAQSRIDMCMKEFRDGAERINKETRAASALYEVIRANTEAGITAQRSLKALVEVLRSAGYRIDYTENLEITGGAPPNDHKLS